MDCQHPCEDFCQWLENLPHHRVYVLAKDQRPVLPPCFHPTLMGEMVSGSLGQYRGPHEAHVHEFPDHWEVHRDKVDPDSDPLGHLLEDAPEYLGSLIAVLAAGFLLGYRGPRENRARSAVLGGLAGVMSLAMGKMFKLISEDAHPPEGQEREDPHYSGNRDQQ